MVVERHGEMVLNEVLAGNPQVHGVPELELFVHALQDLLLDLGLLRHGPLEEDVVPHLIRKVAWFDPLWAALRAINDTSLENMGNSVVGHVDGAVRQRFDQELLVPWNAGAKTEGTTASPLSKPGDGIQERFLDAIIVLPEVLACDVLLDLAAPLLLSVLEVPLVDRSNHTLVTTSGHDLLLWLRVQEGLAFVNHHLPELQLRLLHGRALERTGGHHTLVEA
mmetsp:Transcript_66053/g.157952  ORF Transcript_66053/g.157952 Transcript_66053/m.157952 type:complete len:222 (-) Transcript_66053:1837-2502(-)